jgi:hypothetical protein
MIVELRVAIKIKSDYYCIENKDRKNAELS